MTNDEQKAQLAFAAARAEQEKTIHAQPDYAPPWCVLGVIDAALGRKEEALREGRRALELVPTEKDPVDGMLMIKYLAMIAAWVGEKDLACEQLAIAIRYPLALSPQLWRTEIVSVLGCAARRAVLRKTRRFARAEVILQWQACASFFAKAADTTAMLVIDVPSATEERRARICFLS